MGKKRDSGGKELEVVEEEGEIDEKPPSPAKKQRSIPDEDFAELDDAFADEIEQEILQSRDPKKLNERVNQDMQRPRPGDAYADEPEREMPASIGTGVEKMTFSSLDCGPEHPGLDDVFADDLADDITADPDRKQPSNRVEDFPLSRLDEAFADELERDMFASERVIAGKTSEAAAQHRDEEPKLDDDFADEDVLHNPPRAPAKTTYEILNHGNEEIRLDDEFAEELEEEMLQILADFAEKTSQEKAEHADEEARGHRPAPAVTNEMRHPGPGPSTRYAEDLGLNRRAAAKQTPPKHSPSPPAPASVPSPSPSPPRQAPPMSTQAILVNHDDFFPSLSQQARELDDEYDLGDFFSPPTPPANATPEPAPQPEAPAEPDPTPPRQRFFTSSGSRQDMAVALMRSRRSAAREEQQRRWQMGAATAKKASPKRRGMKGYPSSGTTPSKKTKQPTPLRPGNTKANAPKPPQKPAQDDAENIAPAASQESEFGGGWVDEMALELMI